MSKKGPHGLWITPLYYQIVCILLDKLHFLEIHIIYVLSNRWWNYGTSHFQKTKILGAGRSHLKISYVYSSYIRIQTHRFTNTFFNYLDSSLWCWTFWWCLWKGSWGLILVIEFNWIEVWSPGSSNFESLWASW